MRPSARLLLRLIAGSALAAGVVVPPAALAGPSRPAGPAATWHAWRAPAAMMANHGVYRDHEFVYQDYLYDDHGPNTDGIDRTDLPFGADPDPTGPTPTDTRTSPTGGSTRYAGDFMYAAPDGTHMDDVADLVAFRVAEDARYVDYQVQVADLAKPDSTVVGVCVDEDHNATTGLQTWPFNAGVSSRTGCDHFYTVWGTGGAVTDGHGKTVPLASAGGAVRADPKHDTIDVRVPRAVADPRGRDWRYFVGAGLWDAANNEWYQVPPVPQNVGAPTATGGKIGGPQVWDLLSNNNEPNSYWLEEKQANDLVKQDIGTDFLDVDFSRLASPRNDPDPHLTGFFQRIYVSRFTMKPAKGVDIDRSLGQNFKYLNRYVPYAVVLPRDYYDKPHRQFPFDTCLHALNTNQMMEVYYSEAFNKTDYTPLTGTTPSTGYLGFDQIEGLVNRLDAVYACVLARGEGVGYTGGDGMVDVLEVQHDVLAHYRVDRSRMTLHGTSLGAIGSWYLSELYPDRYASVMPVIFSPALMNSAEDKQMLTNLYDVPVSYCIGTFDEFGQGTQGDPTADQMQADGNEFLYLHYLGRQHEGRMANDVLPFNEALAYPKHLVANPARVRYVFNPGRFAPQLGVTRGSAYWVSGMAPRAKGGVGTVDVTSLARAAQLPKVQTTVDQVWVNTVHDYRARIRGLFRESLAQFHRTFTPAAWEPGWQLLYDGSTERKLAVPPRANGFRLTATGLAALTLDAARMRLSHGVVVGTVTTDGPLTLTLVHLAGHRGPVTVTVPKGTHTVRIA